MGGGVHGTNLGLGLGVPAGHRARAAVPDDGSGANDEAQEYYGVRRGLGKVKLDIFYRVSADR